jgi:hypothetical protein
MRSFLYRRPAVRRFHEHGANLQKPKTTKSQEFNLIDNSDNLRHSASKIVQYFPKITEVDFDVEHDNETQSAIKQHELNNNRKINWTDWNIIDKDSKHYRLLVRKSSAIFLRQPILNKTVCSVPLIVYPEGLHAGEPTNAAAPRGRDPYYERT